MRDLAYAEVSVAGAGALDRLFTYHIPGPLRDRVRVGSVVRVPLRTRRVTGFVVSLSAATDLEEVRDIEALVDCEPVVSKPLLELGRWVSAYYMAPVGDVLKRALPPGMARATRPRVRVVSHPSERELVRWSRENPLRAAVYERLRGRGSVALGEIGRGGPGWGQAARSLIAEGYLELRQELAGRDVEPLRTRWVRALLPPAELRRCAEGVGRRAPRMAAALHALADRGGEMPSGELERAAAVRGDALRRMAARGWVEVVEGREERRADVLWTPEGHSQVRLTDGQSAADARITALLGEARFHTVLLHGVTGSGKTEVFLRAIGRVLGAGRKALVLVPEISLTGQTVGRVRERFGSRVEVYHSGLSPGERRDAWHRIRRGEADVVVGARSAVFVPLEPLGLVVVDEEHEPAYKEPESPRYHARDVALVRARMGRALVILSTATPSLETFRNACTGRYERIVLEERVEGRPLPPVLLVDLREEAARDRVLSVTLRQKIEEALGRREQVLLFLNRRSFAPHVQCETCGHSFSCPRCDVSLAYHAGDGEMKCHLCGLVRPAARSCPSCGGPKLRYGGVGTQRVEREIRRAFPRARLVRMDLDTTRRKGAHDEILDRFRRGEADILLGTQMIAKGLDLPGVSLVGVIHADTALHLPDFRASERTFDLLTQVAGRAGRGEAGGEVVIQTYLPEHKSLACARTHDFLSFYAHAVEARRSAGYPPWTRLIRVLWEGTDLGEVTREAERLAQSLRKGLERAGSRGTEVLGPAPAGFARVKGRHRWHVLVKTREVTLARRVLGAALAERRPSCRRVVDVDPREMM